MGKLFFLALLALLAPRAVLAQQAGAPADTGDIILLVLTDTGHEHRLSWNDLAAMPQAEITTTTIWTEGVQTFAGVAFPTLLDELGETAEWLTLTAVNGYRVERPAAELQLDGALLAILRNGQPMSLRDKGPIWMVYDYDSDPAYRTEVTYANSIWQLDRIEIAH